MPCCPNRQWEPKLITPCRETLEASRLPRESPSDQICERLLYHLAKLAYRSELCLSSEMKDALTSIAKYNTYRSTRIIHILDAANRYGIQLKGHDVLDLGCADGVLTAALLDHGAASVTGVDIDLEAI